MFDFVVFFLLFLPIMDLVRSKTGISSQQRVLVQLSATVFVSAYFAKQVIFHSKPFPRLTRQRKTAKLLRAA